MNRTPARLALAFAASLLGAAAAQRPDAARRANPRRRRGVRGAEGGVSGAAARDPQGGAGRARLARLLQRGERRRFRQAHARFDRRLPDAARRRPATACSSPAQLQALLAEADKARAAVGFRVVDDAKTGARIGAPTRLMAEKNGLTLDFASSADPDLAALYARLTAETPTRKVAYKAIKPGAFFVVSGQDGAMKFYSRFERSDAATPPIRGFTFSYPAAAQNLDRVALAVANSFAPFPPPGAATAPTSNRPPPSTPLRASRRLRSRRRRRCSSRPTAR